MSETVLGHAELIEALEMAQNLIQEAKGVEGPKGGPVTDTLDAAEMWLRKVESALSTPIAAHGAGAVTEAMVERFKKAYGAGLKLVPEEGWKDKTREALEAALRPEAAGQGEADTSWSAIYPNAGGSAGEPLPFTFNEDAMRGGGGGPAGCRPEKPIGYIYDTPRPAPVAPDIVPVAWTNSAQLDKVKGTGNNALLWGEPLPYHEDMPLYGPEALAALSSELAEAKRREDELRASNNIKGKAFADASAKLRAAEAEAARLAHALETATTFSAEIKEALETRIEELTAEVVRLKDENKELVAGLEPFAAVADHFDDEGIVLDDADGVYANTAGDFRRARSLTATKGG